MGFPVAKSYLIKRKPRYNFNKSLSKVLLLGMTIISSKEAVCKCSSEQLFRKILLKSQENNCDKFLFNKIAGCDLTKRVLHHSFFWIIFLNFSRVALF